MQAVLEVGKNNLKVEFDLGQTPSVFVLAAVD
jgi:hypothetical protein